jgi:hypothetical protein
MYSLLRTRLNMFRLVNCVSCVAAWGLLTSASPASAAAWKPLAKDAASVMSADMESIVKQGATRKVWARYDYFAPLRESNGANTVNITTLHVVDCKQQKVGTEREIHRNLQVINREAEPLPLTKPTPGSFNDVLIRAVCES